MSLTCCLVKIEPRDQLFDESAYENDFIFYGDRPNDDSDIEDLIYDGESGEDHGDELNTVRGCI